MPIKSKRILICEKCKKEISVVMGDAIHPKDKAMLDHPICKMCKLKMCLHLKT